MTHQVQILLHIVTELFTRFAVRRQPLPIIAVYPVNKGMTMVPQPNQQYATKNHRRG
jgi:phosphoheptose isomerase